MTIIGLKEFTQNAGKIGERVQKGERFTVVKRSKPLFTIIPPQEKDNDLDTWLDAYLTANHELLVSLKDK